MILMSFQLFASQLITIVRSDRITIREALKQLKLFAFKVTSLEDHEAVNALELALIEACFAFHV